ncbi:MAG TPA: hypothetical protein VMU04_24290 [Candidatus Acidoferrum sp.]|nr:hypothetical protein [Candidatus Acidoferrum sp.]
MKAPTTKDVVFLSALQVTVAVAGMLLVRHWEQRFASSQMPAPLLVSVLADFGPLSLALPLAWLVWVRRVRVTSVPPSAKIRASVGGLALVLALAILFGCAAARAWHVHDRMIEEKLFEITHPHLS